MEERWKMAHAIVKDEHYRNIELIGELPPLGTKIVLSCVQVKTTEKRIANHETYFLSEFERKHVMAKWHVIAWRYVEPIQILEEGIPGNWFNWKNKING